jgi:hypothetical protein
MENFRFPKAALHYKPRGRRDPGRPTKRWADQRTSEQAMMSKLKKSEEEDIHISNHTGVFTFKERRSYAYVSILIFCAFFPEELRHSQTWESFPKC